MATLIWLQAIERLRGTTKRLQRSGGHVIVNLSTRCVGNCAGPQVHVNTCSLKCKELIVNALAETDVLKEVLAEGAISRKEEWDAFRVKQGFTGAFLADLDHHPETKGPAGSTLFPTL
eukprot:185070-Amphidinium_carterae.1